MTFVLYRAFDAEGRLLYVGQSQSAAMRFTAHRAYSEWYGYACKVTFERFGTREEVLAAEKRAILEENPVHNKTLPVRIRASKPPTYGVVAWVRNAYYFDGWYRDRADAEHMLSRLSGYSSDARLVPSDEPLAGKFNDLPRLSVAMRGGIWK